MIVQLVWHIDDAIFHFPTSEEKKNWIDSGKLMSFEFDPYNSDDQADSIMETATSQCFELNTQNSKLLIDTSDDQVTVTAWVKLEVDVRDNLSRDNFTVWAYDKGGWACATIMLTDADGYISEDSGGEFRWT